MNRPAIVASGLVLAGLIVCATFMYQSKSTKDRDTASLRAQRAAMGMPQGGPGGGGGPMTMMKDLGLSAEQQRQMDALEQEFRAEMEKARSANQPPDRSKMDEHFKKISAILTPEQRQKMESMRPPMPGGGMGFPGGPPPGMGGRP